MVDDFGFAYTLVSQDKKLYLFFPFPSIPFSVRVHVRAYLLSVRRKAIHIHADKLYAQKKYLRNYI